MSSSTMNNNNNNNNNNRKRRDISLSNTKSLRRSELIKTQRLSRSLSIPNSLTKINDIQQEYSLSTDINLNNRSLSLRPLSQSYDNNSDIKRDINLNKRDLGSNENTTNLMNKKSTLISLIVKPTTITKQDEIEPNTNKITNLINSYDSDDELDKVKQNSNQLFPIVTSSTNELTKKSQRLDNNNVIIQQTDGKINSSTKLLKLVVPQSINSSSSIKMLSNGDGLSSALRIPTKIHLTKTLSIQNENNSFIISSSSIINKKDKQKSIHDYPLTPPPPIIDNTNILNKLSKQNSYISTEQQIISKRHSSSLSDWSIPPTSELSPTSLTSSSPDLTQNDIHVDNNLKMNHISSCLHSIKSNYVEKIKSIIRPYKLNTKFRSLIKKRQKIKQFYGKKRQFKNKNRYENIFLIKQILNEIIEQVETINNNKNETIIKIKASTNLIHNNTHDIKTKQNDNTTKIEEPTNEMNNQEMKNNHKKGLRRSKKTTNGGIISSSTENVSSSSNDLTDNSISNELKRQTSTPLSFYSVVSSSTDEQSINSPYNQLIVSKTHIFTDIVNELIKGAKGLDKLSYSLVTFTNSIHNFIRLSIEKQNEKVENLQQELEKKCSLQLNRANIFCTRKIQYFITKHSIILNNDHIHEITLIVKYFYLYVLSLNCRKQENEFELLLNDLINEKLTFNNESFYSSTLTTIIEDFILNSSLSNDYLASQPIIINEIEYSLPFIRNTEFEKELLYKNDTCLTKNPFSDEKDLEDYLNHCEHISPNIPYYPVQQSHQPSMYYPSYSHPVVPSSQYYYPPPPTQTSDITPYYYSNIPNYSNCQQSYSYNHPSSYYNSLSSYETTYNTNEQFNYYYNQSTTYTYSQMNSTNDIPLSNNNFLHQSYHRMNSNTQRKHNNQLLENQTTNVIAPQSKSIITTNNIYP